MPLENNYKHGVYIEETTTALQPMLTVADPPVVIGTASKGPTNIPTPITSFRQFAEVFGYTGDWQTFTCEEVAYTFFTLYNLTPIMVINVADSAKHTKNSTKDLSGTSAPFTIENTPMILDTLVVKSGTKTLVLNDDYAVEQSGLTITLTVLKQTNITGDAIQLTYKEWDSTKFTNADVIGGTNVSTGKKTGIEAVEDVYPLHGLIPGTLLAPKFSETPEVALVLASKARNINGVFKTMAVSDIPTSTVIKYSDVNAYKNSHSLVDEHLVLCWPKVGLGDNQYYLSTHLAALAAYVDADKNDGIPLESPSNKILKISGSVLSDGTQVALSKVEANILNGQGIVTALNFNGQRLWGSRTSIFPTSSDPKDVWIPTRRMMNFVGNQLAVNYFSQIDVPINKRLVERVLDKCGCYLNGLTARGALLGGKIACLAEDNPPSSLVDGIIIFRVQICPPSPSRVIQFTLSYDVNMYQNLFS